MIVDANAHAHRKLRNLADFKPLGLRNLPAVAVAYSLDQLSLSDGEFFLGVYENVAGSLRDAIVLTNLCCHVHQSDGWASFPYTDICRVTYGKLTPAKHDTLVVVDLNDGSVIQFDVAGTNLQEHDAKTFDCYAIGAFLNAASSA